MKVSDMQFVANAKSTNLLLSEMAAAELVSGRSLPPFFALYTDYQSQGRGMGQNRWFSSRGENMLVSFYVRPPLPAARQFLFNQYFSIVTAAFLEQFVPEVRIKWPNDLYINGKKVAGILIEHSVCGDRLQYTVAGIGINVNQPSFPPDIPHPTSLLLETGTQHDVAALLQAYRQTLLDHIASLSVEHADRLCRHYMQRLYRLNEYGRYRIHGKELVAAITGIDGYGRLLLCDEHGKHHVCGFKEVTFL